MAGRVNFGKFGIGYWVVVLICAVLGGICLVGALRMMADPAYANSLAAQGYSVVAQTILSLVGALFFGGAAATGLWIRQFSLRPKRPRADDVDDDIDDEADDDPQPRR